MKYPTSLPRILLLLGALAAVGGCATAPSSYSDPIEPVNRAVFAFNTQLDKFLLRPAARAYRYVPSPVRVRIGNVFSNLTEPYTVANDLLQGKFYQAGRDAGRFAINTSIGFLGLNDVAVELGLPQQREDFGQTLAVWGVPPGPYLMLPLLGPGNLRDTAGLVPQFAIGDPLSALDDSAERWYATGLRVLDARTELLGTDEVLELQPDRYLFLREIYRSRRQQQIHDGAPPASPDDEILLDELFEES